MAFTRTPTKNGGQRGRLGRRFTLLLAATVVLVAVLALSQAWWMSLFQGWQDDVEHQAIRPAGNPLPSYDALEDPPETRIIEREVPVVREQPATFVPRQDPVLPERPVHAGAERQAIRLPSIESRVAPTEIQVGWYQDGRRERLAEGCALRPGVSILPAKLITAINSEIGGQVIAETMSTVYSPDPGYENKPLVPIGTRLVGVVNRGEGLTLDRRRIDIGWTEMTNPAGFGGDRSVVQVALGNAFQASADGSAGAGGRVEMNYGQLLAFAALTTLFNVTQRPAADDDSLGDDVRREAGRTIGDVGLEITRRALDWEPRILVDAGTQVRVLIAQTVRVC